MGKWIGRNLETGKEFEGDDETGEATEVPEGTWDADTARRTGGIWPGAMGGHN